MREEVALKINLPESRVQVKGFSCLLYMLASIIISNGFFFIVCWLIQIKNDSSKKNGILHYIRRHEMNKLHWNSTYDRKYIYFFHWMNLTFTLAEKNGKFTLQHQMSTKKIKIIRSHVSIRDPTLITFFSVAECSKISTVVMILCVYVYTQFWNSYFY